MIPANTPRPRQPLTRKRRAAIIAETSRRAWRTRRGTISDIVEFALHAEKMEADKLYANLTHHGYHWQDKLGRWVKGIRED
jgi:hypothetical protein